MTKYIIDNEDYVIFKDLPPEKELIMFELIKDAYDSKDNIEKIKECTIDMINAKFNYYFNNTCLVENYTLLNLYCYHTYNNTFFYNIVYYLIEIGADLSNEYERKNQYSNCLNDLVDDLERYKKYDDDDYTLKIKKLELLINKIKQNSEVPNKFCMRL
jgi:hypothetical protein